MRGSALQDEPRFARLSDRIRNPASSVNPDRLGTIQSTIFETPFIFPIGYSAQITPGILIHYRE